MADQKTDDVRIEPYDGPAGGWGSARSLVEILTREGVPITGSAMLLKQNKPDGYMCTSCAWAKPPSPSPSSIARTAPRRLPGSRRGGGRPRTSSPNTR